MKWITFSVVCVDASAEVVKSLTRKLNIKTDSRLRQDQLLRRGFGTLITGGRMHTQT